MKATLDDISSTTQAKTDQLNNVDLITGPITFTILDIKLGTTDQQPLWISIGLKQLDGKDKPWKPCMNMRRVMIFAWTKAAKTWIGKSVRLYRDPDVTYGKDVHGGIRIEALSHIDKPFEITLQERRGVPITYKIGKLAATETKATPAADNELTASFNAMKAKWKSRSEDRGAAVTVDAFRLFIATATEGCVSADNALKIEKYTTDVIAHINDFIKVNLPEQQ